MSISTEHASDRPASASPSASSAPAATPPNHGSLRETLTSIIIAFVMAFVFRAFIVEAFVIPTGSMAPTLLGAHERLRGPDTGYDWPVGPFSTHKPGRKPDRQQRISGVSDPMSLQQLAPGTVPLHAGDRIVVLKYLYSVYEPQRFDVVVFKSPVDPQTNFIKRLVGLPGEQMALVDGDVFVRRGAPPAPTDSTVPINRWSEPGWTIARKPVRVQRSVWQTIFSSEYTPVGAEWRRPAWIGSDAGAWTIRGQRSYAFTGSGAARLNWNTAQRPILDTYPYNAPQNEYFARHDAMFPVSDLAISCGIEPGPDAPEDGLGFSAVIEARGHEFRADITGADVTLQYRPLPRMRGDEPEYTVLDTARLPAPIAPGRVTNVEFWHVDQALYLFVDGRLVAGGPKRGAYEWDPEQRIKFATGRSIDDLLEQDRGGQVRRTVLSHGSTYRAPSPYFEFSGGPFTLHRVALQRDIYYQCPSQAPGPQFGRGTHPYSVVDLDRHELFVCGDNSPSSADGRLWSSSNPWVRQIDDKPGIVPRNLLIGRAFFVYFPSLLRHGGIPVPDFGRMRFIW